jgi:hypothetical protein
MKQSKVHTVTTTASTEHSLTDAERDTCLAAIERDTYAVLPCTLPIKTIEGANAYIDAYCADVPKREKSEKGFSQTNIVEADAAFRQLLTYKPALQLSYDVFGPMFHLGQDKWTRKYRAVDGHDPQALSWHSDGPLGFPEVDGRIALHTLRFGYFLSDATHDDSGTLEVIRGSHRKKVLHAQESIHRRPYAGVRQDDFLHRAHHYQRQGRHHHRLPQRHLAPGPTQPVGSATDHRLFSVLPHHDAPATPRRALPRRYESL